MIALKSAFRRSVEVLVRAMVPVTVKVSIGTTDPDEHHNINSEVAQFLAGEDTGDVSFNENIDIDIGSIGAYRIDGKIKGQRVFDAVQKLIEDKEAEVTLVIPGSATGRIRMLRTVEAKTGVCIGEADYEGLVVLPQGKVLTAGMIDNCGDDESEAIVELGGLIGNAVVPLDAFEILEYTPAEY
jgi:hypothetical protein